MRKLIPLLLAGATAVASLAALAAAPAYVDGKLEFPADYRQWTYLTTGFDMSYSFSLSKMGHHMMDNVFVNPEAWAAFQKTGTWPDKTVLFIEARRATDKGSINKQGQFQTDDVMGWEAHVKDEARFPGQWAFFAFDDPKTPAKMIPTTTDCYSCHAAHGAVDNTFVQFYPTLLPLATAKGTLAPAYLAEEKKR